MSLRFTDKLIADTQKYFRVRHGKEMSQEDADAFLQSLSSVYLVIAKVERGKAEGGEAPQGPPPDAPLT